VDQTTGCETTAAFTMDEDVVAANIVINTPTQISCIGNVDGTVDYTITYPPGFVGPQDVYILTTVPSPGDTVVNGTLGVGSYVLHVSDGNGCAAGSVVFEVTEPTAIDITYVVNDETCNDLGDINLTVNGGTAPYTYLWSNSATTEDLLNVVADTFSVVVTDANNCTAEINNIIIIEDCIEVPTCEEPVIANVVVEDAECGEDNGSIVITMSDNADYTYSWSDPLIGDTNMPADLAAETYYVTVSHVTDLACFVIDTIVVNNTDGPVIQITSTTDASCTGEDGTAEVTGGFASYQWSPSSSTNSVATDLPAGPFSVTVTDNNGCTNTVNGNIEMNNPLTIDLTIDALADCGVANGAATVNVFNGSGRPSSNLL